jgi:hypothetical protein
MEGIKKPGPQKVRAAFAVCPLNEQREYHITFTVSVVECVTPPPVPVMVIVWFPVLARLPTLTVIVDVPEPGAPMELGLKVTFMLLPPPEADKPIAELKPPETVVVILDPPELLRATLMDVGDALIVKLGAVPVTVRVKVVVFVMLPDVPVTVMLYVPVVVDAATVTVIVEVPAPVMLAGVKPTVTPDG